MDQSCDTPELKYPYFQLQFYFQIIITVVIYLFIYLYYQNFNLVYRKRRVEVGKSDSIGLSCSCDQSSSSVLLFYHYFSKTPLLSIDSLFSSLSSSPSLSPSTSPLTEKEKWNAVNNAIALFQKKICEERGMRGKIRVGKEGFNITVAGGNEEIQSYIKECISHWSFSYLSLHSQQQIDQFFKPSPGCIHVFDSLSVKVVEEITPFGEGKEGIYEPKDWEKSIHYLTPAEFHERIMARNRGESEDIVLDTRNHYETMIGYFDNAILPPVRRFSSLPSYLLANKKELLGQTEEERGKKKDILTYCTGGIRCEKGARWVKDCLVEEEGNKVYTLEGGIHNYLEWAKKEIEEGRMEVEECPWKGRNYVFDARGSLGLGDKIEIKPISTCRGCKEEKTWRMGKCKGIGCHLVIVICENCEREGNTWCCSGCEKVSEIAKENGGKRKGICECEQERRSKLHEGQQTIK